MNFFHLDCLASEVRLNVDLDAALTVLANGCYRWLAQPAAAASRRRPRSSCTGGSSRPAGRWRSRQDRIVVRFDRRSHNPILREAALDREPTPIPWLGGRRLVFSFR